MEKEKKDYSKTVNLPKTDFPMKADLAKRENAFLKMWEEDSIYHKLSDKNQSKPKFILHDGPPYANGNIHLGTALNKVLKDFVVKYKSLSGNYSPYVPGWDCHGLPIEQQCMKEMHIDKHKIDRLKFRAEAGKFAMKYVNIQRDEFKRLGVLGQWEKPYLTMNSKYEESIIRVFGELVKGGFIYRQKKPVYWCPTCETALADAEVEYADHISHSIYVKFPIVEFSKDLAKYYKSKEGSLSVLIWTTTPWTLPANVALAFLPEAKYVVCDFKFDNSNEILLLSKKLLEQVTQKLGVKNYNILAEFDGKILEGIKCKNPLVNRDSVGILADFVSQEEGTGVVHIAPGHGIDDYQAGTKYNLPIISPVDDKGAFTEEVPEFQGHKVFAANHLIIEKLKSLKLLLHEEQITHSYPHCWRCKRAIIFRATPQWFMSVEHSSLRKSMLEIIKSVKWIPSYGEDRIRGMIEVRPDWCLSRQRFWGVPIPVFYCEKCQEPVLDHKVIEHMSELFGKNGSDIWFSASVKELIGPLKLKCKKCSGEEFRKEEDILDVWFDSGVSHEAVLASGEFKDLEWPADMYLEGSDQHRGWFQTSLIPSVAIRKAAPYKSVLTHGFVVDGEGKKMSKSLGNVILPQEIINKYGADILRLWVSASDYREDIRISDEIIRGLVDTYRKIRNTLRFLLGNLFDFEPSQRISYKDLREIDKYALYRLEELKARVVSAYESYEFHKATSNINQFCTVELSGFYLDALKDTLYCDAPNSSQRKSSQTVLWDICCVLTKLIAPILSYTSEEVWQELRKKDNRLSESVFLDEFPKEEKNLIFSEEFKEKWDLLLRIRDKVMLELEKLRKDKKIGSNLEAHIDLYYTAQLKGLDKDLLSFVLGTWDISLTKQVADSNEIEAIASVSKYPKCERCWRHLEGIQEKGICKRCADVVQSLNK